MIEYFICAVCQRHMPAYIFGFRVMLIWGTRGNAALCVCVCVWFRNHMCYYIKGFGLLGGIL
jgi:hypothetical protein